MSTSDQQPVNNLPLEPTPRAIHGFKISRGVLRAMSPIHRMAAETLISKGKWQLVTDSEQEDAGVPGTHTHSDTRRRLSNVNIIIDG